MTSAVALYQAPILLAALVMRAFPGRAAAFDSEGRQT